jgi:hypothetical protein
MKLILKAARQSLIRLGRDESGAAFLVTLALFMFMFLLCSGVYSIGDMVRQRIELQNAADAAAYSAAVIQADTISRVATINRAMAWTYLQLTRRQMDYIVDKWVGLTETRMKEDRDKMEDFWEVYGECDGTHDSGPQPTTYWCGLYGLDSLFAMNCDIQVPIPNNMDKAIPIFQTLFKLHLMGQRGSGNPMLDALPTLEPQILCDKANIVAMNLALIDTVQQLPGKIEEVVPNVLKANLPERLVNAGDFQYYLYQNKTPLSNFMFLNNKKEDERRFLAFAGPHYDTEVRKTFNKKQDNGGQVGSGSKAGGVNHWFVRHDGTRRATSSDIGIQRAYLFGPEGDSSAYQDKPSFSPKAPSCKNEDEDHDSSPDKTTALVSEWHWSATKWLCFPIVDGWVHIPLISAWECDHCKGGSTIDQAGNNCTWPVLDGNFGLLPCPTLLPPTLLLPFAGGGRAYGDDPELLSGGAKKSYYTGELCMPLIMNELFFGKQGSLVVGLSRKCKNPWDEIFGTVSQGLYKAFNPTVKNMWAVSAARAGYRDPSGTGRYQIAYTDPAPLSSRSSPEQLKKNWNLKETDWDAVFLPVKDAWKLCRGNEVKDPGAFVGSSDVLGTIMTEQWQGLNGGAGQSFGEVSAPHRMSGSLDWSGLSQKLTH